MVCGAIIVRDAVSEVRERKGDGGCVVGARGFDRVVWECTAWLDS